MLSGNLEHELGVVSGTTIEGGEDPGQPPFP